jgi:hypothetical protein
MNLSDTIIFYFWTANPLDYIIKADMLFLPSIIQVTNNYTNKNIAKYFEKTYFSILN